MLNRGIWTRDIKAAKNIPQHTLTKTLKVLEQRLLIKSVRSVTSKSKKLYMLYDMAPAKEISGGPWYSEQEFDHGFVSTLREYVLQVVREGNIVAISTICDRIKTSGISTVQRCSVFTVFTTHCALRDDTRLLYAIIGCT